jgi:hypothetical protein
MFLTSRHVAAPTISHSQKAARKDSCGGCAGFGSRFRIIRRVPDHHCFRAGKVQLSQRMAITWDQAFRAPYRRRSLRERPALPEQLAIANTDRPDQVATRYDFDMATRCEKLCNQTPAAAVMVNDQVVAGGDTAGDRIDHVVDELKRKPMLAQGSASGRGRHVGANPIPPACGIGPQDCLALAVAAHRAAVRNAGRRSTGLCFVKTFTTSFTAG